MPCPFCVEVAEYAAGDIVKHILSDHPHEAALMAGVIPTLVAAAKGQWFWVIFGVIVAALMLDDLQNKKELQRQAAPTSTALPWQVPSLVVHVPTTNLNVPYGPYFPHRFYETPYTVVH
jgi:hypothetical protein